MSDRVERCTNVVAKCRTKVPPGYGNQFVDNKGEDQRYCNPCWTEYINAPPDAGVAKKVPVRRRQ